MIRGDNLEHIPEKHYNEEDEIGYKTLTFSWTMIHLKYRNTTMSVLLHVTVIHVTVLTWWCSYTLKMDLQYVVHQ